MQRLEPLVGEFSRTRAALHRVAEELLAPARKPDNEIALLAIAGGFGTPIFTHEEQFMAVHVEGDELVTGRNGLEERAPLTSIAAGAELIGADLFPNGMPADHTPLEIDRTAADQLGLWFAFGRDVLEQLLGEWGEGSSSEVLLWPEHFDVAIEAGSEADGARANYGFSPGDLAHDEPYLYVGPWSGKVSGELWNGVGFSGGELRYSELVEAGDQLGTAVDFCRVRKAALGEL